MHSEKTRACVALRDALVPVIDHVQYVLGVPTIAGDDDSNPLSMVDYNPVKAQLALKYSGENLWQGALSKRHQVDKELYAKAAIGVMFSKIKSPQISDEALVELLAWYRAHQPILMPDEAGEQALQNLDQAINKAREVGLLSTRSQMVVPSR